MKVPCMLCLKTSASQLRSVGRSYRRHVSVKEKIELMPGAEPI
jgi:hypothetical protein